MQLFDDMISHIKAYQTQKESEGKLKELFCSENLSWPSGGNCNLVLQSDTIMELGNPSDESIVLQLWTEDLNLIKDRRISLIGPDISEASAHHLSFGKIVLIGGTGFNDENAYDRYREIDLVRFDVSLMGYMMRATSQYMREWSRISRNAFERGFSLSILGRSLINKYKEIEYINAAEIMFITSSKEDLAALKPFAKKVSEINGAMSKMAQEMSFDCEACDYEAICSEVAAMRNMRKARQVKEARPHA